MNERRTMCGLSTKDELLEQGFVEGSDILTECTGDDLIYMIAFPLNYNTYKTKYTFNVYSVTNGSVIYTRTATFSLSLTALYDSITCTGYDNTSSTTSNAVMPVAKIQKTPFLTLEDGCVLTNYRPVDNQAQIPLTVYFPGITLDNNSYYARLVISNLLWGTIFTTEDIESINQNGNYYLVSCLHLYFSAGLLSGKYFRPLSSGGTGTDYSGLMFKVIKNVDYTYKYYDSMSGIFTNLTSISYERLYSLITIKYSGSYTPVYKYKKYSGKVITPQISSYTYEETYGTLSNTTSNLTILKSTIKYLRDEYLNGNTDVNTNGVYGLIIKVTNAYIYSNSSSTITLRYYYSDGSPSNFGVRLSLEEDGDIDGCYPQTFT